LSRNWPAVQEVFASGKWTYMLPLSFVLMLLTAGVTEEFFFRGFLLNRLLDARLQTWLAILVSSAAFAVYHLPYAYFNPNWPSAGDWPAALMQSFIEAFPIGILLGFMFFWSRRNLLACVLLHALINTLPAMALIKFAR
jgi:membrane protease YdiL (CAAX protease family)